MAFIATIEQARSSRRANQQTAVSLFFVGGVFGVGKSTLCEALRTPLNAEHLKASDLIHFTPEQHDPTRKAVSDIEESQRRLVRAFSSHNRTKPNTVLDGHYCLVDTNQRISPVPITIFQTLNPAALLLVEAEPSVILERLHRRPGRPYSPDLVEQLIFEERHSAMQVSATLDVPLKSWSSGTPIESVIAFFDSSLARTQFLKPL